MSIIALCMVLVVVISLPVMIGIFVYRDARTRGMNGALWALVAALVPTFIGLLIYLLARGNYSNLRCPRCDTPVNERYPMCPNCGARLRPFCSNCGMIVEQNWKVCPECGQPLSAASMDIQAPVQAKDRLTGKILAIVILVPLICLAVLLLSFTTSFSGSGSTSYRDATTSEYLEEMRSEVDAETANKVEAWIAEADMTLNCAYVLRYEHCTENGSNYYYLITVPSIGGTQSTSGIGRSSSIFGTTLTLSLNSSSGERTVFNIMTSGDSEPNLKVTIDGKKIPCKITTVNYNPTLFAVAID